MIRNYRRGQWGRHADCTVNPTVKSLSCASCEPGRLEVHEDTQPGAFRQVKGTPERGKKKEAEGSAKAWPFFVHRAPTDGLQDHESFL